MSANPCVLALYVSSSDNIKRVNKESLVLDSNGVFEDKFYGKNPNRLILLTSTKAYELAKQNGIEMEYGSLGENILIDHTISHLCVGDRFIIGDTVLEVTQNCTLCNGLSAIDSRLPEILKNDRGIFAKTVKMGSIKKNDSVVF